MGGHIPIPRSKLYQITSENLQTLKWWEVPNPKSKCLDSAIVDSYMLLIVERFNSLNKELNRKLHAMKSSFYTDLIEGYEADVQDSLSNVKLNDHEMVLIPILESDHWKLCVIFKDERSVKCYSSKDGSNSVTLENLKQKFLAKELLWRDHGGKDWTTEDVEDLPLHKNTYDSGVFMLVYADYITRRKRFEFNETHMMYFRKKITIEICKSKLLN